MTGPAGLDEWSEPFPGAPVLRRLPAPIPVVVDMAHVLPGPSGFTRADTVALRVRAGGIVLESEMCGTLHSWLRVAADGRWLAQVCVPVRSANGRGHLDLWLWVESANITPQTDHPPQQDDASLNGF
ncbi:hypothetical protein M2275_003114 [Rhodococcus opacus]|nr:hypothetical protein [Rhodococcus opacus]